MAVSIFDLFKVCFGPSSSHTMGPMLASHYFIQELKNKFLFESTHTIVVELYGSLALTGIGHGTDKAILMGLEGELPNKIDTDTIDSRIQQIKENGFLQLNSEKSIPFCKEENLIYYRTKSLPFHPNGMCFKAFDATSKVILSELYYSTGGGFVATKKEVAANQHRSETDAEVPHKYSCGADLLRIASEKNLKISEIVFQNECAIRNGSEVTKQLDYIWQEMNMCIERGFTREGVLPGKLKVKRRAKRIHEELARRLENSLQDPLTVLDWVNLYALSVNEENASSARIVTAPTNGAAGVIPAVMRYYDRFRCHGDKTKIRDFLLTATAIGSLYAENASISGAEVGCQGEVGVACSMAAAGLTAALNGTPEQIEEAAEIGMEHNLGLTCDPIAGLVQIPCIERNAMGAVKAINAARIALRGDGKHHVSLDSVIQTMKQTGKDMNSKYKETSRGGLAVNVPLC